MSTTSCVTTATIHSNASHIAQNPKKAYRRHLKHARTVGLEQVSAGEPDGRKRPSMESDAYGRTRPSIESDASSIRCSLSSDCTVLQSGPPASACLGRVRMGTSPTHVQFSA